MDLSNMKLPKVSKFILLIALILIISILSAIVLISPMAVLFFLLRFYHLRRLAKIEIKYKALQYDKPTNN